MRLLRRFLPLLVAALVVGNRTAAAISIDTLGDSGSATSVPTIGVEGTSYFASSSAVGGGRSFTVVKTGSGAGVTRLEVVDSTLGYSQGAHTGMGAVTWDGNTDPTTVDPAGLGGIDFTQDDATAFQFALLFFDFPLAQPLQLSLKLYDSHTPDGSRFSEVTVTIDQQWNEPEPFPLTLPFSLFTAPGSSSIQAPNGLTFGTATNLGAGGAADLSSIGAVSLTFNGLLNSRAPDIILSALGTNGRCAIVPTNTGAVVDECSVCLDDQKANLGKDRCGVCLNGPPGYDYESNKVFDSCTLCPAETEYSFPDGRKDVCGVCLGGPAPYVYTDLRDECGNCPNSPKFNSGKDACGVCGGSAQNAAECGGEECSIVPPTEQIKIFEKRLLEKASALRKRFLSDQVRWKVRKCGGSLKTAQQKVSKAYSSISAKGKKIFQKGIEVCGDSCVTVSYAAEVAALNQYFSALETEASRLAKAVQRCYQRQKIVVKPSNGGGGVVKTIADVRKGLNQLINECRSSKVCAPHN